MSDPQNAALNGCWQMGKGNPGRWLASPRTVDFPDLADVDECPNSYVTEREMHALDLWESAKASGIPLTPHIEDADALLVQSFGILEVESMRISNSRAEHRRKQARS